MALKRRVHPDAQAELKEALAWHKERNPNSAESLAAEIRKYRVDTAKNPDMWAIFPGWTGKPDVRSRKLPNFPYRIVYFSDGTHFNVIAYAHEKRAPLYWSGRVDYWDNLAKKLGGTT
ncbi:MAG: type II toxin-antitoxin system RelE/ParE family toxin [Cellulomonadaceae bacterium]|nr:type II toxin-antitoxin system RelE/ParE family toxin [Cellulomonadaceae bacterium]